MPDHAPLRPGDPAAVGGYRLTGRLGEGGQGIVYLATGADGTRVAVKLLRADLVGDAQASERFVREVAMARRVAPFCTAQVIETGLSDGRPYIVSEYIDGRTLKLLNVIDEYTRECPAIVVARSIDADAVVATLDRLSAVRGAPGFVRFDNGPEFIARAVADWCRFNDVAIVFIDPGSPWQNAWIESFNGRLRDELLNSWQFDSLLEARVIIEDWRIDYNDHRPHTAHGDLTPTEFAQAWTIKQPEAA